MRPKLGFNPLETRRLLCMDADLLAYEDGQQVWRYISSMPTSSCRAMRNNVSPAFKKCSESQLDSLAKTFISE